MSGDLNKAEKLIIIPEHGVAHAPAPRTLGVTHQYGNRIRICTTSFEKTADHNTIDEDLQKIKASLSLSEQLGLDAFLLRQSTEFRQKRADQLGPPREWNLAACLNEPDEESSSAPGTSFSSPQPGLGRFAGAIAVGVIMVSGPNHLRLSYAEQVKITAEIQEGLKELGKFNHGADITFLANSEVIDLKIADQPSPRDESFWRNQALAKLGFSPNLNGVAEYLRDLRTKTAADTAFCVFFTKYSVPHFAYACLGHHYVVMHYQNGDWGPDDIDRVFAHETGHIFGAPDEYAGSRCECNQDYGFFQQRNSNCVHCSNGTEKCIMKVNDWKICAATTWHLGFRWPIGQPINDAAKTLTTPAVCAFNQHLYVFSVNHTTANKGAIMVTHSQDGLSWPRATQITQPAATNHAPAAAYFDGRLFLFWRNFRGDLATACSADGTLWQVGLDRDVGDTTDDGFSCIQFEGRLHLFWRNQQDQDHVYTMTSDDGDYWSFPAKLEPHLRTNSVPAPVVFDGHLYLFWRDINRHTLMQITLSESSQHRNAQEIYTDPIGTAPTGLAMDDQMTIFWGDPQGVIHFSDSHDARTWSSEPIAINHRRDRTSAAPACCRFTYRGEDQPFLFWKSADTEQRLFFSP